MAPQQLEALEREELQELARRVKEYQNLKSYSDNALAKKFPGIGSSKTYNKILNADFHQLDLERQLDNYRAVVALIDAVGDQEETSEELYEDLTPVIHLRRAVLETMRETNIARIIFLLADTGCGKSSAGKLLLDKFGQRILWIEADECWGDSPMAFFAEILKARGVKDIPYSLMDRRDAAIETLSQSRVCMIIDEAHHMGPRCLNIIKTLVNRTPGEFVCLAMPPLWRKLESAAYEELRQLKGNRLADRIELNGIAKKDIVRFIERRTAGFADSADMTPAVKMILDRCRNRGNMAFLREVCVKATDYADGKPMTLDHFTQAVSAEMQRRGA